LTFDTEDFISENSVPGLHNILEILKKYELPALFFITGHMAEKLANFPATVDLLNTHQIGYHSSSHSVHPTIFEFTDVKSYDEAYQNSLARETSHINPLTGVIEGTGGINLLRALFPKKQINSFRAPGYCWTPPHLAALKTLGITYDFSTDICIEPVNFQEITFYPFTILTTNWNGRIGEHLRLQRLTLKREVSVLTIHPSTMVNQLEWDLIYYPKFSKCRLNPPNLFRLPARTPNEITSIFRKFGLLLRHLVTLQKMHLLKVASKPTPTNRTLFPGLEDAEESYRLSINWAKGFGYNPKFLHSHFTQFFQLNLKSKNTRS
jgi:peptidoglycan/xylan/chitin deacetylase (PgdA/CDA1 family)